MADKKEKAADKQTRISTGVVTRLVKDVSYYRKEEAQIRAKIEKMKEGGADASDISKQEEVLRETLMMIPDVKNKIEHAVDDLYAVVMANLTGDPSILVKAKDALQAASPIIGKAYEEPGASGGQKVEEEY